jgi:UDP-glucose 4-epimerase
MVIPSFVERALAGQPLEIHGDGQQTRCFCHVQDTIRALTALMERTDVQGEIFNVGSTERIAIAELAERVRGLTESESELVYVPYDEVYGEGIEDMLHRIPSIAKVKAVVGWEPRRNLDRILEDVVEHQRTASLAEV